MKGKPGRLEVKLDKVDVDAAMALRHSGLKPGPYVRLAVADSGCGMSREITEPDLRAVLHHPEPGGRQRAGPVGRPRHRPKLRRSDHRLQRSGQGQHVQRLSARCCLRKAPAAETAAAPAAETGTERILLVDDDAGQLKSLARMLERLGYRITTRSSGRTAAAAFKKDPDAFDLVITDQTMPGISGIELARDLVKVRPDIKIILNTGFSEKVNGESVGKDGIRAFIMKPFTARELSGTHPQGARGKKLTRRRGGYPASGDVGDRLRALGHDADRGAAAVRLQAGRRSCPRRGGRAGGGRRGSRRPSGRPTCT